LKKKEVYYFSHDSNAHADQKILTLRSEYGWEGYGIFWVLVELMRNEPDYMLAQCTINALAYHLQIKPDLLESIVSLCCSIGLFEQTDNKFFAPSLMRRMKRYEGIVEQKRGAARTRWDKEHNLDADALHMQSTCNAIKLNETKLNKRKDNTNSQDLSSKKKETTGNTTSEHPSLKEKAVLDFDLFWKEYPKKEGKPSAVKSWNKQNPPLAAVLAALKVHKGLRQWQDYQYIPYPSTWLNNRRWEDEIPAEFVKETKPQHQRDMLQVMKEGMRNVGK
jgi:hypothetical protein